MIQTFNTQMQTLHDEHMKTKKSLKRREKNIDQMIDKMCKQQSLLSQIFSELKPIQSSKSQINLHRYELEYQKLKDDLKLYHERHLIKHGSARQLAGGNAGTGKVYNKPMPDSHRNPPETHRNPDTNQKHVKRVQAMPMPRKQSSKDKALDQSVSSARVSEGRKNQGSAGGGQTPISYQDRSPNVDKNRNF